MRRIPIKLLSNTPPGIYQVLSLDLLATRWQPDLNFLVMTKTASDLDRVRDLERSGLSNIAAFEANDIEIGDVAIVRPDRSEAAVAFRSSDVHHSLFVTNRCNSYCLMCSQPPTSRDDSWLVDQAMQVARHISDSPAAIGITGGEPLLLGERLKELIECINANHPATNIEILSNGRLLADKTTASTILQGMSSNVSWMIPLYGPAPLLHDYIVQRHGAFDETIGGLLRLQESGQPIQLRIVLIKSVLEHLEELCNFIGRNLPFVREVALMGCEPIGFALANRGECELNLDDWQEALLTATSVLRRHRIRYILMNIPLCGLPVALRESAAQSISDWKNSYLAECDMCDLKSRCTGLFKWHETNWAPVKIRPIKLEG